MTGKIYNEIELLGASITILGTAHVSAQSVLDLETLFAKIKPDVLAIELCESRIEAITNKNRWQNLDIVQAIKEDKFWIIFSSLILSAVQKKIGESTGMQVGAEMRRALELGKQAKNTKILAIDRDISITLKRAWRKISLWSKLILVSDLVASLFIRQKISVTEIEELKKEDVLEELMRSIPKSAGGLKEVILSERDMYMAQKIRGIIPKKKSATPIKILIVVGAAHVQGIKKNLIVEHETSNLDELRHIPSKSFAQRATLSTVVLSVFIVGALIFRPVTDWQTVQRLIVFWILIRSSSAGLGSIIAKAHIYTTFITVLMAPFSYFLSFFGFRLWMASAIIQVKLSKPRVGDFERISQDLDSMKGFFKGLYENKILNLFWLIWLVSLGLTIGNLIFIYYIIDIFS